jgi:hypothetical protein
MVRESDAFSDDLQAAILIPKAVKRECYHYLQSRGVRQRRISVRLLTAGLVLLLRDHVTSLGKITIDLEYEGSALGDIKGELLRQLRQRAPGLGSDQIVFGQIGKKSAAHALALRTYRGEQNPDQRVTVRVLMGILE